LSRKIFTQIGSAGANFFHTEGRTNRRTNRRWVT